MRGIFPILVRNVSLRWYSQYVVGTEMVEIAKQHLQGN